MHLSHTKHRKTTLALSLLLLSMGNAYGNIGRHDINFSDYISFGNNTGKFVAGKTNTIVYHLDGSLSGVIYTPIPQFTDVEDKGSASLYGNNQFIISVAHVGNNYAVFNSRYNRPGVNLFKDFYLYNTAKGTEVKRRFNPDYSVHEFELGAGGYVDFEIDRASKLVYDAIPHETIGNEENFKKLVKKGALTTRVGAGVNVVALTPDTKIHKVIDSGFLVGGTNQIQYFDGYLPKTIKHGDPNVLGPIQSIQINQVTPLDSSSEPGDSGSPGFVWDETKKKWILFGANDRGGQHVGYGKTNEFRSSPKYADQIISKYDTKTISDKNVSLTQKGGDVTVNTETYNATTFNSDNINISVQDSILTVNKKVDTGWGSFKFHENATVNGSDNNSQLLTAGFIINQTKTVNYNLDIGSNNNLIKLGNGTLIINGNSQQSEHPSLDNSTLSVGDGLTVLNSTRGPVANNIRIATGRAKVRLDQDQQINGSNVSFGVNGGELDLNGHNLSFDEIYHLDKGATIANNNSSNKSNFTFTNNQDRTFLGNFNGNLDVTFDPSKISSSSTATSSKPASTTSSINILVKDPQADEKAKHEAEVKEKLKYISPTGSDFTTSGSDDDATADTVVNYDKVNGPITTTEPTWHLRSPNTNIKGNFTIASGKVILEGDAILYSGGHHKINLPDMNYSANFNITNTSVKAGATLELGRGAKLNTSLTLENSAILSVNATGKVLDDINPWYLGQGRDWQVDLNTIELNHSISFNPTTNSQNVQAATTAQSLTKDSAPTTSTANFKLNLENNHKIVINATVSGQVNLLKTGTGDAHFTSDSSKAFGSVNLEAGSLRFAKASDVANLAFYTANNQTILGIDHQLNTVSASTTETDKSQYHTQQTQANSNLSSILHNLNNNFNGVLSLNGEITALSSTNEVTDNKIVNQLNQHTNLFLGSNQTLDLGNKYDKNSILNTSLTTLNLGGDKGHINVYGLANDQDSTQRTINIGNNQFAQGSVALHGISTHPNLSVNLKGLTHLDIIDNKLGITTDLSANPTHNNHNAQTTELDNIQKYSNSFGKFIHLGYGSSVNYQASSLVADDSTGFLLIGAYAENLPTLKTLPEHTQSTSTNVITFGQQESTSSNDNHQLDPHSIPIAPIEATYHTYHINNLDLSHTNQAIGASKYQKVIIEHLTPNAQHDYNFSGSGEVQINDTLATGIDDILNGNLITFKHNVNVDAQFHTGGKIVLNANNSNFHGTFNVSGNTLTTDLAHQNNPQDKTGSIALIQGQDYGFGVGNVFNLGDGGIVNLNGHNASLVLGENSKLSAITAFSNTTQINPAHVNDQRVHLYFTNERGSTVDVNTQLVGNMDVHFTNGAQYNLTLNTNKLIGDYYVDNSIVSYTGDTLGNYNNPAVKATVHLQNKSTLLLNGSSLAHGATLVVDGITNQNLFAADDNSYVNITATAPGQNINNIVLHANLTINGLGQSNTNALNLGRTYLNHHDLTINNLSFNGLDVVDNTVKDDKQRVVAVPETSSRLILNNSTYSTGGSNNHFLSNTKFKQIILNNSTLSFGQYSYLNQKNGQELPTVSYDLISNNLTNIEVVGHSYLEARNSAAFYSNIHIDAGNTLTISGSTEKITNNVENPHNNLTLNFNLSGDGLVNFNLSGRSPGEDFLNNLEHFHGTLDVSQPLFGINDQFGTDYTGFNFTNWTGNTTLNFALAGDKTAVVKNTSEKYYTAPNGRQRKDRNGGKIITLTDLTQYHGTLVADEGNFIFAGTKALAGDYTVNLRQGDFLVSTNESERAVTGHFHVNSSNQLNYPVINITKSGKGTVELANGVQLDDIVRANINEGTLAINATASNKLFHQNFTYYVAKDANLEIHSDADVNFVARNVGAGSLVINQTNNHTVNLNLHDLNLTGETITIANGTLNQILTDSNYTQTRQLAGKGTWELSQGKLDSSTHAVTSAVTTIIDPSSSNNEEIEHADLPTMMCGSDEYGIPQVCKDKELFGHKDTHADPSLYHLLGFGDNNLDTNYRIVTITNPKILGNFNGSILFNKYTQLDLNYTNANFNHTALVSVKDTNQHLVRNLNSTVLQLGDISDYHGQIIAENGDLSLNGVKALQSPALISAKADHKIILNGVSLDHDLTTITSNQLHIDAKTVEKVGNLDIHFNTDKTIFTNLTHLDVQAGNLSFNHNIFTDNQGSVTLHNNRITFNLVPTNGESTTDSTHAPKLFGKFTGSGDLVLNTSAQLQSDQLSENINLGIYTGNYQLTLVPSDKVLAPNIYGNGNLSLVTTADNINEVIAVKDNFKNFTGTLGLTKNVTLDLQSNNQAVLSISGAGTIRSNFGDNKNPSTQADDQSGFFDLTTDNSPVIHASTLGINALELSEADHKITTSSGTPTIGGGDKRKTVSLDLTTNHPDFTGSIQAYNGDIVIVGDHTPTSANYTLNGSRIIFNDQDKNKLDLAKFNITNQQPNVKTSAFVNDVDRTLVLNNKTATNISNLELNKGNIVTSDTIALNTLVNNGFINIGDNSIYLNDYDDKQGKGVIALNLSYPQPNSSPKPRVVIKDQSEATPVAPDLNRNDVHLKLLGDYRKFIADLKDKTIPLVETKGRFEIINLEDVNHNSLYHLVVKADGSHKNISTTYIADPHSSGTLPAEPDNTSSKQSNTGKAETNPAQPNTPSKPSTIKPSENNRPTTPTNSQTEAQSHNSKANSNNSQDTTPNSNDHTTSYSLGRVVSEQAIAIFRQVSALQTISLSPDLAHEFKDTVGIRGFYNNLSDLDYKTYSSDNTTTQYKNSSSVTGWGFTAGKAIKFNNILVNPMLDIKYGSITTSSDVKGESQTTNLDSSILSTKLKLNFKVGDFKIKSYLGYDYASFSSSGTNSANISLLNTLFSVGYDQYINLHNDIDFIITHDLGLNYQPILSSSLNKVDTAVQDITNDSPSSFFYNVNFNFTYKQWSLDLGGQIRYSPSKLILHNDYENLTSELNSSTSFQGQATLNYQINSNVGINFQTQVNTYYYSLNLDTKLGINFSW